MLAILRTEILKDLIYNSSQTYDLKYAIQKQERE